MEYSKNTKPDHSPHTVLKEEERGKLYQTIPDQQHPGSLRELEVSVALLDVIIRPNLLESIPAELIITRLKKHHLDDSEGDEGGEEEPAHWREDLEIDRLCGASKRGDDTFDLRDTRVGPEEGEHGIVDGAEQSEDEHLESVFFDDLKGE